MHTWFDAFRTLKLIHYLRDHGLPSIPFDSLLLAPQIDSLLAYESVLPVMLSALRQELNKPERPSN